MVIKVIYEDGRSFISCLYDDEKVMREDIERRKADMGWTVYEIHELPDGRCEG